MPLDLREDLAEALSSERGRRAMAAAIQPLIDSAVQRAVEAVRLDEMLSPKQAAADVDLTPGAFRQAMCGDSKLRALFVGTGRTLRIKRRDLRGWFAERKPRRRKTTIGAGR